MSLGARVLAVLLIAEITILFVLAAAILIKGTPDGYSFAAFNPANWTFASLGPLLVVTFICYIGFEQTAIYGEEVRNPTKTIPRATYSAVITLMVIYTFMAWIIEMGIGPSNLKHVLSGDLTNVVFNVGDKYVGTLMTDVMRILVVTSFFAGVLALQNAGSRYPLFDVAFTPHPRTLLPHEREKRQPYVRCRGADGSRRRLDRDFRPVQVRPVHPSHHLDEYADPARRDRSTDRNIGRRRRLLLAGASWRDAVEPSNRTGCCRHRTDHRARPDSRQNAPAHGTGHRQKQHHLRSAGSRLHRRLLAQRLDRPGCENCAGNQPDARRQEQAGNLLGFLLAAAELLSHLVVIIDGALRQDQLVTPAVIEHQFATVTTEGREIRIFGSHHWADLRPGVAKEVDEVLRRALASALIAFARETRARIVAEGVETDAEPRTPEQLGADSAQGYFLARPLPLSEALRQPFPQPRSGNDTGGGDAPS